MKLKLNYTGVIFIFHSGNDSYRVSYKPLPKAEQTTAKQLKQSVIVTQNGTEASKWTVSSFANKSNAASLIQRSFDET